MSVQSFVIEHHATKGTGILLISLKTACIKDRRRHIAFESPWYRLAFTNDVIVMQEGLGEPEGVGTNALFMTSNGYGMVNHMQVGLTQICMPIELFPNSPVLSLLCFQSRLCSNYAQFWWSKFQQLLAIRH